MRELTKAIAKVHINHGRVILYLEPFLIYRTSAVGNAFGELWGSRLDGRSSMWTPFDDTAIAMSQANGEWQDYVVQTARSLIRTTQADGIFLDSAGWRLNIAEETKQEVVRNSSIENAMAVLDLVDRVRKAIRIEVPDAVVLSETASGPHVQAYGWRCQRRFKRFIRYLDRKRDNRRTTPHLSGPVRPSSSKHL